MKKFVQVPSILAPIQTSPGFEKKKLSEYKLDLMASCGFKCRYCSSPAGNYQRINREFFADLTEAQTGERTYPAKDPELALVWPDVLDRLRDQLAKKRPNCGAGKTLVFSMLTDAFSPPLVKQGITEEALRLVLERTQFRIRVLTKSSLVGTPKWIRFFLEHPDRFIIGLSCGTLNDEWAKQVERFTSTPRARLCALRNLQNAGVPTFGMLCPVFPEVLDGDHIERLIDATRPHMCEHVWCEPYNDRQNWQPIRDSFPPDSPTAKCLTAAYEHHRYELWSSYATTVYERLATKAKAEGWTDKLRYLLYEKLITESDAPRFAGLQGVLLQGKPDEDGESTNPAIAALQAVEPLRLVAAVDTTGEPGTPVTPPDAVPAIAHDLVHGEPMEVPSLAERLTVSVSMPEGMSGNGSSRNGLPQGDRFDQATVTVPLAITASPVTSAGGRPSFPIDVFPQQVVRFATQVATAMQCPVDIPGLAILVVAATAIGAARALKVKPGWQEMPGIFAAVVAPPGQIKTPPMREVMRPIFEEQERLLREHAAGKNDPAVVAVDEEDRSDDGGETALPAAPQTPGLVHLFTTDSTIEAMAGMLKSSPKGVVLYRDELSGWARSMNLYRGGRGADQQFYLSVWSGETVKIDRKSSRGGPIVLTNPLVGVLGSIQPDVLNQLEVEGAPEDGFIDRILFAFCEQGSFPGWSDQGIDDAVRADWHNLVRRLISLEPDLSTGNFPRPRILSLDERGEQALVKFFLELADRVNHGNPSSSPGACAKMRSYCVRFALVIHLLRHAAGEFGETANEGVIDGEDVRRAVLLCDYFIAHGSIAHQRLRQSPTDKDVAKLLAWMTRKEWPHCTARDVMRAGVVGITAKSEAEKLLNAAVDRGFGTWETPAHDRQRLRRFVRADVTHPTDR